MSFFKERGKALLIGTFCVFLIVQQIALQYGRSYRAQREKIDKNGNDKLAWYEVDQLQKAWRKAAVDDPIALIKMSDQAELKSARARLKEAEVEIQNSVKRVQGITGNRREFFGKVHAYYNHSASAIGAIVEFLLAKRGEYAVKGNEINFKDENDGEIFRRLIHHLSDLHQEKQELDAFILQHN